MTIIENDKVSLKLENDILCCIYKGPVLDSDTADFVIKTRLEFTGDTSYPGLVELIGVTEITREARERFAKPDSMQNVKHVAIVIESVIQKIFINFFNIIHRPSLPTKIFNDRESAIKWLLNFED